MSDTLLRWKYLIASASNNLEQNPGWAVEVKQAQAPFRQELQALLEQSFVLPGRLEHGWECHYGPEHAQESAQWDEHADTLLNWVRQAWVQHPQVACLLSDELLQALQTHTCTPYPLNPVTFYYSSIRGKETQRPEAHNLLPLWLALAYAPASYWQDKAPALRSILLSRAEDLPLNLLAACAGLFSDIGCRYATGPRVRPPSPGSTLALVLRYPAEWEKLVHALSDLFPESPITKAGARLACGYARMLREVEMQDAARPDGQRYGQAPLLPYDGHGYERKWDAPHHEAVRQQWLPIKRRLDRRQAPYDRKGRLQYWQDWVRAVPACLNEDLYLVLKQEFEIERDAIAELLCAMSLHLHQPTVLRAYEQAVCVLERVMLKTCAPTCEYDSTQDFLRQRCAEAVTRYGLVPGLEFKDEALQLLMEPAQTSRWSWFK